jgi:hypothetical protein
VPCSRGPSPWLAPELAQGAYATAAPSSQSCRPQLERQEEPASPSGSAGEVDRSSEHALGPKLTRLPVSPAGITSGSLELLIRAFPSPNPCRGRIHLARSPSAVTCFALRPIAQSPHRPDRPIAQIARSPSAVARFALRPIAQIARSPSVCSPSVVPSSPSAQCSSLVAPSPGRPVAPSPGRPSPGSPSDSTLLTPLPAGPEMQLCSPRAACRQGGRRVGCVAASYLLRIISPSQMRPHLVKRPDRRCNIFVCHQTRPRLP